ncbi:potassium translocating ATPase, subunit C [uncultured Desulfobacterium sp.]|uniref:Potassium-transporting ATPase KdpC subunit n=1 Tax=uncultured Desulfobacterium sp. TaxID=201089 RepID=A0A445MUR6_9BACT|nr:potassium translocating ATPase, subunit C [uncultured Desulfobacterium sp.]
MSDTKKHINVYQQIITSGRIVIASMTICCLLYGLALLSFGRLVMQDSADGSLILNDHKETIGSELIAQGFTRPEYFWPRPSAVAYNASASAGSNFSPTNPALRHRAEAIITKMEAKAGNPIPADLVSASGSGLDPHITLAAARYQAARVAAARGLSDALVMGLLEKSAKSPGGPLTPDPVVNVLLINMALDRLKK